MPSKLKQPAQTPCNSHLNYIYCATNPKAVKITTLLTQYLYNNQRLDLPGIGTFFLDPSAIDSLENSKQRSAVMEGISFVNDYTIKDSPDLVAYISAQTGKMKALAAADLDSHLQLALQFLNIGKPFTFEGIGTLVKIKLSERECDFTPISISADRVKEFANRETSKTSSREESAAGYESFLNEPRVKMEWSKPLVGLLLLAGLGLAVWGGYALSKRTKQKPVEEIVTQTVPVADTINHDSLAKKSLVNASYKYVLEVAPGKRAFKRYNQLKTNQWDVQLETKDSVQYKLFLLLPALNADTTRIVDSLTVMTGKKVYIELQN